MDYPAEVTERVSGKPFGARWPAGVEEMAVVALPNATEGILASVKSLTVVCWRRWL